MKFDGTNWIPVGSAISQGNSQCASIIIDKNDTPYIAYVHTYASDTMKATVKKFDGTNWVDVGNPNFSIAGIGQLTMALDNKGKIYTAFCEPYQKTLRPAAMEYTENTTAINETKNNFSFSVYPNPANAKFQIIFSPSMADKLQLKITDLKGKTIYSENIYCNGEFKKEIDLGKNAKGIYFIDILCGNERRTRKIILE